VVEDEFVDQRVGGLRRGRRREGGEREEGEQGGGGARPGAEGHRVLLSGRVWGTRVWRTRIRETPHRKLVGSHRILAARCDSARSAVWRARGGALGE
jgi:hypothetical protein